MYADSRCTPFEMRLRKPLTYSDARQSFIEIVAHLIKRLIEICAHHVCRFQMHAFRNATTQTDHRVRYLRAGDDATVADHRVVDLRVFDFRRRQETRAREDRSLCVEQIELRNLRREIEVRPIERADRSDVFPVTVKHESLHRTRTDRRGNHFLAEIHPARSEEHTSE